MQSPLWRVRGRARDFIRPVPATGRFQPDCAKNLRESLHRQKTAGTKKGRPLPYSILLALGCQCHRRLTDAALPHSRGQRHEQETREMASGTVKWFNTTKGYGFIAPDSGGKDVFVHISAVERSGLTGLADNQKVTFDIEAGRDGRESAVNLSLA